MTPDDSPDGILAGFGNLVRDLFGKREEKGPVERTCSSLHGVLNAKYTPRLGRRYVTSREKLRRMQNGVCLFTQNREVEPEHYGSRIVHVASNGRGENINNLLDRYEALDLEEDFSRNLVKSVAKRKLDKLEKRKTRPYDVRKKIGEYQNLLEKLDDKETKSIPDDSDTVKECFEEARKYFKNNFKYTVIGIPKYEDRKRFAEKIASTVYHCAVCEPSPHWRGRVVGLKKLWVEGEMEPPDWSGEDCRTLRKFIHLTEEGYTGQRTLHKYLY